MSYLAHSKKDNSSPQTYADHVEGVYTRAVKYAKEAEAYALKTNGLLCSVAGCSAIWHDLGKLDDKNQAVLRGESPGSHLPVNHVDAGTAALIKQNCPYSTLNVFAHHRGLTEICEDATFRDEHPAVRKHVDETLKVLLLRHGKEITISEKSREESHDYDGDPNLLMRLMLSCLWLCIPTHNSQVQILFQA